ncbi:MAG: ubiquitin-activating E1 FCCH domain-containing protein [Sterolibacterium sp.]
MTLPSIQNSFVAGEISPSLFGRTDLAKWHNGASTMRNFFANYRGGASSRAGLAYVGTCKQTGDNPPRDIRFQFNINQGYALEFGDNYMRIKSDGAYVIEDPVAITGATEANPIVITAPLHGYSNGDWVYITNMVGMTELNGLTWIVDNKTTNTFQLLDLFGNPVDSSSFGTYISGGSSSRLYTLATPYMAVDLPYLKFTQSADTMTLTCVNQITGTEYRAQELLRLGATNWTITPVDFSASISSPSNITVTAQSSTTIDTQYSYVVTSVNRAGDESIIGERGSVSNNNISIYAGSNTVTWNSVDGAVSYNVYRSVPAYTPQNVPVGVSYGYIGSSFGNQFVDGNILADFTIVPPNHYDPFAPGKILEVSVTAQGSGYSQSTIGYSVTTSTGTGFGGIPVEANGKFVGFLISNQGTGYLSGDTITITGGTGGTADLVVGPASGTYPGVVAYYQQRRAYANTLNNPDTYWMSKPGTYDNMDSAIPTVASDAIVGTPWAQQINGIQFMVPMTSALIMLTGSGAWNVNGGNNSDITPIDQTAQAQAYNGCSATVPPIVVNYNILYVQSKGSIVRDLAYNFVINVYTGEDKTVLANQLFQGYQIVQWAYSEEPYKIIWAVRNDGVLLSFTYLKEQDVYAWARHDTNGLVVGVVSVTEPPVDAVYVIVKRYVQGQWKYYSERMDNRDWQNVESTFCVDSGLKWPQPTPDAILTPAAADGTSNITAVNLIAGGSGYTAPTVIAIDPTGIGSGATFSATVAGGVITAINVLTPGDGYVGGTDLIISDSTGEGAVAAPLITNYVEFSASSSVFSSDSVGQVIRVGGGKAIVITYTSPTSVIADVVQPITETIPNDPSLQPVPASPGDWTITPTTDVVSGLNHLEGKTVAILADGSVMANQVVTNGQITLPSAYSSIVVGLPYTCQIQSLFLDPAGIPTVQGKRKNIYSVTVRVNDSRGISVGTNQPDASTQPNGATLPWTNMKEVKERNALITAGSAIPLFTGDYYINVPASWDTRGQVAVQQTYPLPANVLAIVSNYMVGDTAS